MTGAQFSWRSLGSPAWPAPEKFLGVGSACWLCGGQTDGAGWRRDFLPPTFTNHNLAAAPWSDTICCACAYLSSKASWEAYVAAHPEKGLKTGHAMSWRFYSHVFAEDYHDCPTRVRWRTHLTEPPKPPFVFVFSESGQKHLIFRSAVAYDRDRYPLQFEDTRVWIERAGFAQLLEAFCALVTLGLSRDMVLTGRYTSQALRRLPLADWRRWEEVIAPWRLRQPTWMQVARGCAVGLRDKKEEAA